MMGWLIDYINTYNLWDELYANYCQIELKMSTIELAEHMFNGPITNHLRYHYWEQLNILEDKNEISLSFRRSVDQSK